MKRMIVHILTALYEPFWAAVVFSILVGCLHICAKQISKDSTNEAKTIFKLFLSEIRNNKSFVIRLAYYFYIALILFRTLINRNMWLNPLDNVLGVWGLFRNGEFTTEVIENFILFIPFTFLRESIGKKSESNKAGRIISRSFHSAFCFSILIECLQLFLRLGTFELSDIFFNTIGGITGGIIVVFCNEIKILRKRNG